MPLKTETVLGPSHTVYEAQDDMEGSRMGRNVPQILDEYRNQILALLQGQVAHFCRDHLVEVEAYPLVHAAEELLTNAFRDGNHGDPRKRVMVDCKLEIDAAAVTATLHVEDEGEGIPLAIWNRDPEEVTAKYHESETDEDMRGGYGMFVLKALYNLERIGRGNILKAMIKMPILPPKKEEQEGHGKK